MQYLDSYFENIIQKYGNSSLSDAVKLTVDKITPKYISDFNYREHLVGLLVGNVQSGKTSHMFGIISAMADEGFAVFLLLTSDNTLLHSQTLERAKNDLSNFCVCDESDFLLFQKNNLKSPVIIVLKKNYRVLKTWKTNFTSSKLCEGNPMFIIDDEADAASLNTLINQKKVSTINRELNNIKHISASSIYLQVTGTPQSIILQTLSSGWRPNYVDYFEPGNGYIGGNLLFNGIEGDPLVILTDDDESEDILTEDEFPENKLKIALLTHLISSAQILLASLGNVSNFLIHPSVKTVEHDKFAEKIGDYLNELNGNIVDSITIESFKNIYNNLLKTYNDLLPFSDILAFIQNALENNKICIKVLNSKSNFLENTNYNDGINIIVGGNSLGRGVTFPKLQTVYYCRLSKTPQADTMWQHSRIFGYDRIQGLIRVFMPPLLYKLFCEINSTNNSIIAQIQKYNSIDNLKIYYSEKIKPTRKNVLDNQQLSLIYGGVNYFPFNPVNLDIEALDKFLCNFTDEGHYSVNLNLFITILGYIDDELKDWNKLAFIKFINSYILNNKSMQGILIVRRERDIAKGTGSLLSPNDRQLGKSFSNNLVLTMYKITGNKGWENQKLWIPNIKFPDNIVFYDIHCSNSTLLNEAIVE